MKKLICLIALMSPLGSASMPSMGGAPSMQMRINLMAKEQHKSSLKKADVPMTPFWQDIINHYFLWVGLSTFSPIIFCLQAYLGSEIFVGFDPDEKSRWLRLLSLGRHLLLDLVISFLIVLLPATLSNNDITEEKYFKESLLRPTRFIFGIFFLEVPVILITEIIYYFSASPFDNTMHLMPAIYGPCIASIIILLSLKAYDYYRKKRVPLFLRTPFQSGFFALSPDKQH